MAWKLVGKGWQTAAGALGGALLDCVFPRACGLCDGPAVLPGDSLCAECMEAVSRSWRQPYCPRCGHTAPPFGLRESGCGKCPPHQPPYVRVIRVGSYTEAYRTLLQRFKFGGREELDAFFVRHLARRLANSDLFEEIDALVPVPTCWVHRLRRRFHPAEVVCRQVGGRCGVPVAPLLRRVAGGPHQVGLPLTSRAANVHGKFRLARGCAVDGARLCLVDDVMTSGATAAECARVLKRCGAGEVYVAVLARAAEDPLTLQYA